MIAAIAVWRNLPRWLHYLGMGHRTTWRPDCARIDRERILRGLSQDRLASMAHVDPGTLSDLLNGRRRPQLGTITAIARVLDLVLPDLIEFE